MACILMPECNFMHGSFRCLLPEETMDMEVKVKMMRGIHTFRRDHTTQVISCKTMEFQTLSLPISDKEDADLSGARRQEWYPIICKCQPTWQKYSTAEGPQFPKGQLIRRGPKYP